MEADRALRLPHLPNGLTADSQGNLYGNTSVGGKYGYGVVFELTP
jgi:uncharacterized repeat protein (TIGR03803 family)